jgi:hypothetical protein
MDNEEPKKEQKKEKKYKKAGMTGWYDPLQLAKTAVEVVISETLGRHSDRRITQALASTDLPPDKPYHNMSEEVGDFWIDYVSDVGDGFNSTCTMAYYLTEPNLKLKRKKEDGEGSEPPEYETQTGRILVFGGDEVYPLATREFYQNKLVLPYKAVFPRKKVADPVTKKRIDVPNAPNVFAVPGNHDWYDSIVGFSFHFLERHFAAVSYFCGWRTVQDRSYFAIKLPGGWWLFGTDMQLGSSLDSPQMKYFQDLVKKHIGENDKIILCNAEPYWITDKMSRDRSESNNAAMGYFEGHILQKKAVVFIAGDRHYYRRHEEQTDEPKENVTDCTGKRQKIVAGGGGAFLHPTHKEPVDTVGRSPVYDLKKSFPDPDESARLGWRNLFFIRWNWKFGLLTGFLYVLTARAFISTHLGQYGLRDFWTAIKAAFHGTLTEPFSLFWVIAIILGFVLFTDKKSKWFRWIAGPLHSLAHLTGVFLVSWLVARWVNPALPPMLWTTLQLLFAGVLIYIGGFFVSPFIMGAYLFLSLNWCGRHHNEAFSALRIEDYKNFVRFKINENGDLTIFPIGVKKVFKNWPDPTKLRGKRIVPNKPEKDNEAFLIEGPICYVKLPAEAVEHPDEFQE